MKDLLKHIVWEHRPPAEKETVRVQGLPIRLPARQGLVVVKGDHAGLEVRSLAGQSLTAELLYPALDAALPQGWLVEAEELHLTRVYPWCVHQRTGQSGCIEYRLYSLRNAEWLDQPREASVHVSMYGKLNRGLRCWWGDLPPLLAALVQDFPPVEAALKVYDPVLRDGYRDPGSDSGLQAVLDSLKAMEVMSV